MNWRNSFQHWRALLGGVTPVAPGRAHDGFAPQGQSFSALADRAWGEQLQELQDARTAWRQNPLARRLVGLVTAYVVGNGVTVSAPRPALHRFARAWWAANQMDLRLADWCDELSRSGELFIVLYPDPAGGLGSVRLRPAACIDAVRANPEDYEDEWAYHDSTLGFSTDAAAWWHAPGAPAGSGPAGIGAAEAGRADGVQAAAGAPVMLHYAVNRPAGSLRGESDLAPVLPWLRRYSRWLEDRVRLNAGVRAFLWVVKAPARLRADLLERYRTPPEPGSVVIADEQESWTAVAPTLQAGDAANDGRAIRWMVAAGGLGTSLLDLGEGEDSNLATGQAMGELRRRFLRRRQAYVGWLLADLLAHAWRLQSAAHPAASLPGRDGRPVSAADFVVELPDIAPEDNQRLAAAATALADGLRRLADLVGSGPTFRRVALRWFAKFSGEQISADEFERILSEGQPVAQGG